MDRLSLLESKLEELASEVARLHERVDELGTSDRPQSIPLTAQSGAGPDEAAAPRPAEVQKHPSEPDIAPWTMLVGRTLLVLGGGYLVRALTESEQIPGWAGVTLGLLYGLTWLVVADRSGSRGRIQSASFHGAAAALVTFPLLFEATARFHQLTSWTSAALLAVTAALLLTVAMRRQLRILAVLVVAGAFVTGIGAMAATRDLGPYALAITLIGLATLVTLERRQWTWLALLGGITAHLAVALALAAALIEQGQDRDGGATAALVAALLLFLGYVGHGVRRCLEPGQVPLWLVAGQAISASLVGYGGALLLAAHPAPETTGTQLVLVLAIAGVGAGLALFFASSFFALSRQGGPRIEGWRAELLRGLGTILAALGTAVLTPRPGLVFVVLAVALTALNHLKDRPTLSLDAIVLLSLAALIENVPAALFKALLLSPDELAAFFDPPRLAAIGLIAVVALACSFSNAPTRPWPDGFGTGSKLLAMALATVALFVVLCALLAHPMALSGDSGALSALRTALLSLCAITLAWSTRFERLRLAGWLVYPLLAVTAIKILLQDFPAGRPLTLFPALLCFGGALIVGPRLMRHANRDYPTETG